jgi:hypothetical protein
MNKEEDYIVIWEAPKIVPPEFRLYYDDKGSVVCYTTEKKEGNYIVIDALTFAAARPDVRVIDGKISTVTPNAIVMKLQPAEEGQSCYNQNVSIVVDDSFDGPVTKWKINLYELR